MLTRGAMGRDEWFHQNMVHLGFNLKGIMWYWYHSVTGIKQWTISFCYYFRKQQCHVTDNAISRFQGNVLFLYSEAATKCALYKKFS